MKFKVTAEQGIDVPAVAAVEGKAEVPAIPAVPATPAQDAYHANQGDIVDLNDEQVAAIDATLLEVAPEA